MTSRVKKHQLLGEITGAIVGRVPECTEEILGVKYRLRYLKPEAGDWVTANTPGNTVSAALLNLRKPTVAAALMSIDAGTEEGEIPIEKLFGLPDDMDVGRKENLLSQPKELRDWRRGEILEWLREELDDYVIDKLYEAYSKLIPKHREAMAEIEGFLKRTPSADLSAS